MNKELVSVIIPTYNRSETIKNAINSVLQQTYQHLEVIIVDDASKDDTQRIVESIKDFRIQYFKNEHQMGANISRNVGINQAKGSLIAFCDSADLWAKDKLEKQIKKMHETSADIIFCSEKVTEAGKTYIVPFAEQKAMVMQNRILELLATENCVDTSTLVVKKQCFDQVGLFHLELPRLQEYEWILRAAQKNKITFLDETLVFAFVRSDSISSDVEKYCKAVPIIYRDHFDFFKSYGKQIDFLLSTIKILNTKQATYDVYEKYFTNLKEIENTLQKNANKYVKYIDWEQLYLSSFHYIFEKDFIHNFVAKNKDDGKTLSNLLEQKDSSFCIFGAGEISQKLCRWLTKQDHLSSVKAIVVTSCKNNNKNINSVSIVEIAHCDQTLKNLPIILAVSENIVYEIICEMKNFGFEKVICLSQEDLQNFEYENQ